MFMKIVFLSFFLLAVFWFFLCGVNYRAKGVMFPADLGNVKKVDSSGKMVRLQGRLYFLRVFGMSKKAMKKFHYRMHHQAKEFRKNPTEVEKMLWHSLRGKQVGGFKFRRQHPVGGYVVDFACLPLKLIVEVDGGVHDKRKEEDAMRTEWLEGQGYRVIRFKNKQVLRNLDNVLAEILRICKEMKT